MNKSLNLLIKTFKNIKTQYSHNKDFIEQVQKVEQGWQN